MVVAEDHGVVLDGDSRRVVGRLFLPGESVAPRRPRAEIIIDRVREMPNRAAERLRDQVENDFARRHHDLRGMIAAHADAALARAGESIDPDSPQYFVLGATFTSEFAVEATALCNPSAAPDVDQSGLRPGELRVIVTLRQIGEGHVSSLGFARAIVGPGAVWRFDERSTPLRTPAVTPGPAGWSDYVAEFEADSPVTSRVLLPAIEEERNGIEDGRMTRFTDEDGTADFRITYTGYDGQTVTPRLLISRDLKSFASYRLTGSAATHKGVAIFPRRVGGELYALVRSDGETNSLAHSRDGIAWGRETAIRSPRLGWEVVQSGNCGPPIETPHGWLVLTHGVGVMRTYSLGAILLDLDDPRKLIGVLPEPLLRAQLDDPLGYVPRVVYSCGGFLHDGTVWIPYGVDDKRVRVASVELQALIEGML